MTQQKRDSFDLDYAVSLAVQGNLDPLDQAVKVLCARFGSGQPPTVINDARNDALLAVIQLIRKRQKSYVIAPQVCTIVRRALYRADKVKDKLAMTDVMRLDDPDIRFDATAPASEPSTEEMYLIAEELALTLAAIEQLAQTQPRAHLVLSAVTNGEDHVEALRAAFGDDTAKNAAVILSRARATLRELTSRRKKGT